MYDNILGIETKKIDDKYRIILPKFTGVEIEEELCLILRQDYLEIRSIESVKVELERLKEELKKANNYEIDAFYQEKINGITSCFKGSVKVDKQRRIIIGREIVEAYKLDEGIKIEGAVDSIRIWNLNKFLEYQNNNLTKLSRK